MQVPLPYNGGSAKTLLPSQASVGAAARLAGGVARAAFGLFRGPHRLPSKHQCVCMVCRTHCSLPQHVQLSLAVRHSAAAFACRPAGGGGSGGAHHAPGALRLHISRLTAPYTTSYRRATPVNKPLPELVPSHSSSAQQAGFTPTSSLARAHCEQPPVSRLPQQSSSQHRCVHTQPSGAASAVTAVGEPASGIGSCALLPRSPAALPPALSCRRRSSHAHPACS